mmetsp:Transcript_60711/g.198764  ORF Transcript_60711/g.198764 Transcript_60711/m.198764 type:complete len:224 (+) Transcript_60711:1751-2422(+)
MNFGLQPDRGGKGTHSVTIRRQCRPQPQGHRHRLQHRLQRCSVSSAARRRQRQRAEAQLLGRGGRAGGCRVEGHALQPWINGPPEHILDVDGENRRRCFPSICSGCWTPLDVQVEGVDRQLETACDGLHQALVHGAVLGIPVHLQLAASPPLHRRGPILAAPRVTAAAAAAATRLAAVLHDAERDRGHRDHRAALPKLFPRNIELDACGPRLPQLPTRRQDAV